MSINPQSLQSMTIAERRPQFSVCFTSWRPDAHVIQARDDEDFPLFAAPFSIGSAMITPTIRPVGHSQVASPT